MAESTNPEMFELYEEIEDDDPLVGLADKEVYQVVRTLPKKQQLIFKELMGHYRLQKKTHGTVIPTYREVRSIIRRSFPDMPTTSADEIAGLQLQYLQEERMKEMCTRLGYVAVKASAPEEEAEPEPFRPVLRFEPHPVDEGESSESEDEERSGEKGEEPGAAIKQEVDVKPPRLKTQYGGMKSLRKMLGGDDDCIVTRVRRGDDPMSNFVEDDESEMVLIELSEEEEEEIVDDLSEASMESEGLTREELKALLSGLSNSHRNLSDRLKELAKASSRLTSGQVEETIHHVTTELGAYPGLQDILDTHDRMEVGLILATGVRKFQEFELVRAKRLKGDVHSYDSLARRFNVTKRILQECCATAKWRIQGKESEQPQPGRRGLHSKTPAATAERKARRVVPTKIETEPADTPKTD